jgi:hypothetical protein
MRRSGNAVAQVCQRIGWRPSLVVQVGVGGHHQEVDVIRETWPDTEFIGFDPMPVKDYPGEFVQTAISSFIGESTLNVKRRHADGSTLLPMEDSRVRRREKVLVETLDHALHLPTSDPDDHVLLWVDCEGSELAALMGGERFIKNVEMVNVELTAMQCNSNSPVDIYNWLVEHGFYMLWVHTMRIPDGQWDCLAVRKHLFCPECCCFPMETKRWAAST